MCEMEVCGVNFVDIANEDLYKEWYCVRYQRSPSALIVEVSKDAAWRVYKELQNTSAFVQRQGSISDREGSVHYVLPSFIEPSQEEWGFGPVISSSFSADDWIQWKCVIPSLVDSAHQRSYQWARAYAVTATLATIFNALDSYEGSELLRIPGRPQLFHVKHMESAVGIYGSALSVKVSPAVCVWIAKRFQGTPVRIPRAETAMRQVYRRMTGRGLGRFDYVDFRVDVRPPKWLDITCPGNAVGLDPDDYYETSISQGYTLAPHNTDTPLQALMLLAGLASVWEEAGRWLAKENK